jgi:hypothetical protein
MVALQVVAQAAADAIIFQRSAMNDVNSMIAKSRQALDDSYGTLARTASW